MEQKNGVDSSTGVSLAEETIGGSFHSVLVPVYLKWGLLTFTSLIWNIVVTDAVITGNTKGWYIGLWSVPTLIAAIMIDIRYRKARRLKSMSRYDSNMETAMRVFEKTLKHLSESSDKSQGAEIKITVVAGHVAGHAELKVSAGGDFTELRHFNVGKG
ncbi:hypothetical protein ES703_122347 [subsurface metagenome]